jgi:hypothetical protein
MILIKLMWDSCEIGVMVSMLVLWVMMLRGLVRRYQRFGGTCSLSLPRRPTWMSSVSSELASLRCRLGYMLNQQETKPGSPQKRIKVRSKIDPIKLQWNPLNCFGYKKCWYWLGRTDENSYMSSLLALSVRPVYSYHYPAYLYACSLVESPIVLYEQLITLKQFLNRILHSSREALESAVISR